MTVIGLQVGLLLSGAMLTETVFAFPGIGTWIQEAIDNRDYPVLQGGILFIAVDRRARQPAGRHLVRPPQPAHPAGGEADVARSRSRPVVLESPGSGALERRLPARCVRNPAAIVGLVIIGTFVIVAVFAPLIAPYSPLEQNLDLVADGCCPGPSREHLMGVDDLGRDELSRIIYGARYSLLIGVVSVTVGLSFGAAARRDRRATSAASTA